jgi:hypothetical protein
MAIERALAGFVNRACGSTGDQALEFERGQKGGYRVELGKHIGISGHGGKGIC